MLYLGILLYRDCQSFFNFKILGGPAVAIQVVLTKNRRFLSPAHEQDLEGLELLDVQTLPRILHWCSALRLEESIQTGMH